MKNSETRMLVAGLKKLRPSTDDELLIASVACLTCGFSLCFLAYRLHFRWRLRDLKATQLYEVTALREETRRKEMNAGTAGLEQGFHPHMLDVGNLLREAWGELAEVSIARCWALAEILPTKHQQIIQDLRKKKDDVCGSGDRGNSGASSGVAANHLKESMENVSSCLSIADSETRAAFSDLGDMLDSLGVKQGVGVSEVAVNAVVEWLTLEARQDVSRVVELDGQGEMLRNIKSNTGYRSDDDFDRPNEDFGSKRKTPHELSRLFEVYMSMQWPWGVPRGSTIACGSQGTSIFLTPLRSVSVIHMRRTWRRWAEMVN